jgi:peptide/nickel transport system substrate-binding protein
MALIAAACAPVAPAAPASAGAEPVRGGTLIFGSSKELANSHPFIATSSVSLYIKELMYESLLAFDDESQLQGMLAESWQGADGGRTWTFKLRKGVKFHDGKEMTAKDVVWSVRYVQDPNNGAGGKAIIESIQKVEAVDQYTVRFTLTGPSAIFPSLVGNIRAVAVIPEGSLPPGATKVEGAPPPGTGPFTFEKWVPGDQTSFKRFDSYWDGPPYLDRVVFKLIANDTARVNALRAADIQVAERAGVEFIRRIDAGEVKGIKYQGARLSGFRRLVFNHTSPVFKDRTMREAVAYAIDPKRFMDEVYFGYGTITKLKMPPGSVWEKGAALPDRPRDVAKAKQLLQRAGYTGQPISGIGRRGEHEEIWESIVLMLKEAGINVKVEITESGVYDNRQQKADFDLTLRGGRTAEDPSDGLKQDYYCEAGPERFANFAGYCSKKVDELFDALEVEPDAAKRMAIFKELANTMYADVVEVPLGYTGDRFFVWLDPMVQGFRATDGGSYTSRYGGIKRTWFKK